MKNSLIFSWDDKSFFVNRSNGTQITLTLLRACMHMAPPLIFEFRYVLGECCRFELHILILDAANDLLMIVIANLPSERCCVAGKAGLSRLHMAYSLAVLHVLHVLHSATRCTHILLTSTRNHQPVAAIRTTYQAS